jgi:predicted lipase
MNKKLKKFLIKSGISAGEIYDITDSMLASYNGKYGTPKNKLFHQKILKIDHVRVVVGQPNHETFLICFKGTNGTSEWIHNFDAVKIDSPFVEVSGKVHKGFLFRFEHMQKEINDIFKSISKMEEVPKRLIFVGHSLGATTALYSALFARTFFGKDTEIISIGFGSPRPGNRRFEKDAEKQLDAIAVFRNGEDLVTKVPTSWMGYRHVGKFIKVGKWTASKKFLTILASIPFFHFYGIKETTDDHYPDLYVKHLFKDLEKYIFKDLRKLQ